MRATSCSVGRCPSGVNWSTTWGKYWLRLCNKSSRDMPDCVISALILSAPRAPAKSFGDISLLARCRPTNGGCRYGRSAELFEQVIQAATQDAAGSAACEHTADTALSRSRRPPLLPGSGVLVPPPGTAPGLAGRADG